ncbi:hypothetical protein, partial [Bradyrhizobium sp.]|uniref:hypothetical protein n=1 Tax=Bradyrhizobium sp. TaxID=376 RepID=UPI0039E5E053
LPDLTRLASGSSTANLPVSIWGQKGWKASGYHFVQLDLAQHPGNSRSAQPLGCASAAKVALV